MVKIPVTVVRKIWRQICRQIFRETRTLTLPVPAYPRGQESGAVPGAIASPPELHPTEPKPGLAGTREPLLVIEDLSRQVVERLCCEVRELAAGTIARLRELVGDLPASANHHHSEPYGLLQHSLEVALKMMEEFERTLVGEAQLGPSVGSSEIPPDSRQWQYLSFLAGLGHDLGKLFDMDVRAGDRRWSPLNETYAEFLCQAKTEPVLRWNEDRVRGSHAQFSPWLLHHLLGPADIEFIGLERVSRLTAALMGAHASHQSTQLACLVSKLDQESVEQAAPEWMTKRHDSKVKQLVLALRDLISYGRLSVNSPGANVYVTSGKAAVVVPLSIGVARGYLKQEASVRLPSNHRLYDLLAQAEIVEADEDRQCVKRIRVPGKHGPVELSAVIFNQDTIIPPEILPTLPKVTFEVAPEESNPAVVVANSNEGKPTPVAHPLG